MGEELLKIFDDNRNPIGIASRSEVHTLGYWHETFHCWFISRELEEDYIYLQIRSDSKKDYPSLFDITAAGHILASETVVDGVREVREEIGIDLTIQELVSLGTINYCVVNEKLIDKELAHVFLYESNRTFDDFTLDKEEVAGMIKIKISDFRALWHNGIEKVEVDGFIIDKSGERLVFNKKVGKSSFVSHELSYYEAVLNLIDNYLKCRSRL